jgi:cellobiose dehydrogenase (acceptor)
MKYFRVGALGALTATATASTFQNGTYDYIVVGGGPAGIITAERFTKAGNKVLLLERGVGPTVATGDNQTLSWNDTLTPIDVPGLSASLGDTDVFSEDMCTDTAGEAACVLGGGVTVNYMVFVHPPAHDFDDVKWPPGWQWDDVSPAADRLYARNPGTILPSADGKRYDQVAYDVFSNFFSKIGWTSVDMITQPNEKYQVYSYPAWNIKDQKRAGPVRTYLPLVEDNSNFTLSLATKVNRLVRSGSTVTGVELEVNGTTEIVTIAPNGRVVLAAGTMSTPRILFNSGIGPKSEIEVAQDSGVTLPPSDEWIHLPVGYNFKDHDIFSIIVETNGTFSPLNGTNVLDGTDTQDIDQYEQENSGVLTQGKHRMIFFSSNVASDGVKRYYQGSCAPTAPGEITITTYMTHGLTSQGRLGLALNGSTITLQSPYLQTDGDREAATEFISSLVADFTDPSSGFSLSTYTNTSAILGSLTSGIHYVGTAKMGLDDGRYDNGTSVVDTNTKVYGTDNLVRFSFSSQSYFYEQLNID